jgi:hypothetical protein
LFTFQIGLHKDDIEALEFIQRSLGFGKVIVNKDVATFRVRVQAEIQTIIDIFSCRPLNSTKHLNFLAFKKAFELYTGNPKTPELNKEINSLLSNMNKKRLDYTIDSTLLKPRITGL